MLPPLMSWPMWPDGQHAGHADRHEGRKEGGMTIRSL